MSVKFENINPLQYTAWDELVSLHRDCTFFHTSIWAKVLSESYHFTPAYFAAMEQNKLIAAVPIMEVKSMLTGRRGVSLPFSDYCKPIITATSCFPDIVASILAHGKKSGWRSFEWRDGGSLGQNITPASRYYVHALELSPSEEHLLSGFRTSTRSNINKAIRAGVTVNLYNTQEAIDEFYRLNSLTRKRHGVPPQPYAFFRKVFELIIAKAMGFVALATYKNKTIAGAVYFHFGGKALCKYAASDRAYQNLRANNLVVWEAMRWYAQNGYSSFCFGRTEPENQGLRQFKNGWGTHERMINYYNYDLRWGIGISEGLKVKPWQNKVFQKMPLTLLQTIGAISYKHLG